VLRPVKNGFVVSLAIDPEEQESLSRTIEWLKKRHTRQATNKRASQRFDARGEPCVIYAGDIEIECKLADVSADGAMLVTDAAAVLELDVSVAVGRVAARVVRRQPDRIGVEFAAAQSLKTLLVDLKAIRDPADKGAERQFFDSGERA
jgi:PilZ domain